MEGAVGGDAALFLLHCVPCFVGEVFFLPWADVDLGAVGVCLGLDAGGVWGVVVDA